MRVEYVRQGDYMVPLAAKLLACPDYQLIRKLEAAIANERFAGLIGSMPEQTYDDLVKSMTVHDVDLRERPMDEYSDSGYVYLVESIKNLRGGAATRWLYLRTLVLPDTEDFVDVFISLKKLGYSINPTVYDECAYLILEPSTVHGEYIVSSYVDSRRDAIRWFHR